MPAVLTLAQQEACRMEDGAETGEGVDRCLLKTNQAWKDGSGLAGEGTPLPLGGVFQHAHSWNASSPSVSRAGREELQFAIVNCLFSPLSRHMKQLWWLEGAVKVCSVPGLFST